MKTETKQTVQITPKQFEFAKAQACLLVKESGQIYIQAIDAYGFQREMTVQAEGEAGTYCVHVYQHPGKRRICEIKAKLGKAFAAKLLDYAERYPDLLFNAASERQARSNGFVHLCEAIFRSDDGISDFVKY